MLAFVERTFTHVIKVLNGFVRRTGVDTLSFVEQSQVVEESEDGITRLVDGENDGLAATGQTWRKTEHERRLVEYASRSRRFSPVTDVWVPVQQSYDAVSRVGVESGRRLV